jgi:hypothetical protein
MIAQHSIIIINGDTLVTLSVVYEGFFSKAVLQTNTIFNRSVYDNGN